MKNWIDKWFNEKTSLVLVGIGLFFVGLALLLFFWKEDLSISQSIDAGKVGQFGDFIGGLVGSLWALAGVILFYVALTEQRKDFATNREVFQNQVEALNQQIREFELQRRELDQCGPLFDESFGYLTFGFDFSALKITDIFKGSFGNILKSCFSKATNWSCVVQ